MSADLDALLISLYVLVDDLLPTRRRRLGRPVRISDSELICLAIAQVLLDCPNERRFLRLARARLGHLFPYIPGQSGFNKRLRRWRRSCSKRSRCSRGCRRRSATGSGCSTRRRCRALPHARLCAAPRWPATAATATAARTAAGSGASASTCSARPTGSRSASSSRPRTLPNASVAAELLERVLAGGEIVIADKGFAGAEFEQHVTRARRPPAAPRPQRRASPLRLPRRHPAMDRVRPSTRSKTNSRSNATAAAPSPALSAASPDACSRSPPSSSTTGSSATPADTLTAYAATRAGYEKSPRLGGVGAAGLSQVAHRGLGQVHAPRFASPSDSKVTVGNEVVNRPHGLSFEAGIPLSRARPRRSALLDAPSPTPIIRRAPSDNRDENAALQRGAAVRDSARVRRAFRLDRSRDLACPAPLRRAPTSRSRRSCRPDGAGRALRRPRRPAGDAVRRSSLGCRSPLFVGRAPAGAAVLRRASRATGSSAARTGCERPRRGRPSSTASWPP